MKGRPRSVLQLTEHLPSKALSSNPCTTKFKSKQMEDPNLSHETTRGKHFKTLM
jgi:hypothetical protein